MVPLQACCFNDSCFEIMHQAEVAYIRGFDLCHFAVCRGDSTAPAARPEVGSWDLHNLDSQVTDPCQIRIESATQTLTMRVNQGRITGYPIRVVTPAAIQLVPIAVSDEHDVAIIVGPPGKSGQPCQRMPGMSPHSQGNLPRSTCICEDLYVFFQIIDIDFPRVTAGEIAQYGYIPFDPGISVQFHSDILVHYPRWSTREASS